MSTKFDHCCIAVILWRAGGGGGGGCDSAGERERNPP